MTIIHKIKQQDELIKTLQSRLSKIMQEAEQLRLKLSETAIHLAARNSEIEQLRKERDDYKALYDVMVERYTELAKKVRGENGN